VCPMASPCRLLLVAAVSLLCVAEVSAQCFDSKKTVKCQRKIARNPRKCARARFLNKCRLSCNGCNVPIGQPAPTIDIACHCTLYRNGASARDTQACVKNEYANGEMHVICMGSYNNFCPSDMSKCPFSPPPPSPMPPPSPPPSPPETPPPSPSVPPGAPGTVVTHYVETTMILSGDVATAQGQAAAVKSDLLAQFPGATDVIITITPASVRMLIYIIFSSLADATSCATDFSTTPVSTITSSWFSTASVTVEQVANTTATFGEVDPSSGEDASGDAGSGSGP